MTKKVRIENADTSSHVVVVRSWIRGQNGEPDVLESEVELKHAADLIERFIWREKYLVIEEK